MALMISGAFFRPGALAANGSLRPLEAMVIQEGGRKKPFLTFAQEELLLIHGRTSFTHPETGERREALAQIVEMWAKPSAWANVPIVLVDYRPLKSAIGLDVSRRHFSLQELLAASKLWDIARQANEVRRVNRNAKITSIQQKALDTVKKVEVLNSLLNGEIFRVVPNPESSVGTWGTLDKLTEWYGARGAEVLSLAKKFFRSVESGEPDPQAAAELVSSLRALAPEFFPTQGLVGAELAYVHWHPFRWAWIVLLAGLGLMAVTAIAKSGAGFWIGFISSLISLGFLTWGMVARVVISGRAPVTNMYETVVWLALGILIFSLAFAWRARERLYFWASQPVAIIALMLADSAPTVVSPALEPLVAVLRSNFWLTVHVMTIVTSYSAFAVATGLGHIILWKYASGREHDFTRLAKLLTSSLHLGVWLLGTGIVLGAVWANYSWGRFWDWDPKETFSLVAFLGYLVTLHGRLFGFWKTVGLAAGSVLGFLLVLYAWYGVNYILAAGLHSYGFGSGNHLWFYTLIAAEIIFVISTICIGLLRRRTLPKPLATAAES